MKPLLLYTLVLAPVVNAWTFRYTNATNNATILHDTGKLNCTKIDLAGGKLFSWDPEGAKLCVSLYYDAKCVTRGGLGCNPWKRNASTNFYGVDIITDEQAETATVSTATSSPTSRTSTASTSTTTVTPTPTSTSAANDTSSSGSSLSGGAIAGIVIGVVSAVIMVAALFFFFGRRHRKKAALAHGQGDALQGPYGPDTSDRAETEGVTSSQGISEKQASSDGGAFRPAPGSRVVELAGQNRAAELAHSPLSELEDQSASPTHRF